ncbi:MAG: type IV secretory system conjugative DNA transfer family protein [Chloroflexota bacterium]
MMKNLKQISDVTNKDVVMLKKKPARRSVKITLLVVWFVAAAAAYLWHPHIQTLESQVLKLCFSALGILIWATWPVGQIFWEQVQIGSLAIYEDQFMYLFYGGSALVPMLFFLIRWYWLRLPASPKRADEYRIEKHRLKMGRMTPAEALRDYRQAAGSGFPLVSLEADPDKRGDKVIGLPELKAHCAILAPTGAGKGMNFTDVICSTRHAMVVIDPKGEQLARTGGYRAQMGPVYTLPGHGIDLSRYYDFSNRDDVTELHYHMMTPWKDSQTVFADKTKALFSAVGIFAKVHGLNPIYVLLSLAESDPSVSLNALYEVAPDLVMAFTNGKKPEEMDRMAGSSWGTFATRLYQYWQHVDTITRSGAWSIPDDWVEQKGTIYITYPFDALKGAGGVVSAVLAGLMRQRIRTDARIPMTVGIDELIAVGIGNIDTYLATVRSYGVSILTYIQDYAQLEQNYGKRADTILANSAYKLWYRPNEMRTAAMIERIYGTELKPSYSHSRTLQKERMEVDMGKRSRSVSQNLSVVPALSEGAVKSMGDDEVIAEIGNRVVRGYRLWPVPRFDELQKYPQPIILRASDTPESLEWRKYLPVVADTDAQKPSKEKSKRKSRYTG